MAEGRGVPGLPTFVCVGAQKAGTTLLFEVLRRHPDIYLPAAKELHFFDREENYARGIDAYRRDNFAGAGAGQVLGELTPSYMFFDQAPARIREHLGPDVRIVVLLRNPVDRAYSHYWMQFKRGWETLPFFAAIDREGERIRSGPDQHAKFSYAARGLYAGQFERLLGLFPRENIHVACFEDLTADIPRVAGRICDFIGVPAEALPPPRAAGKVNSSALDAEQFARGAELNSGYVDAPGPGSPQEYPRLSSRGRALLGSFYENDVRRLEALIGRELKSLGYP